MIIHGIAITCKVNKRKILINENMYRILFFFHVYPLKLIDNICISEINR